MPRVSEDHRAAMRTRIQEATIRVIAAKGMAGLTMADVIAESGLSAGAIYGYYKGKSELIRDVARNVLTARHEQIVNLTAERPLKPWPEAVGAMLHAMPEGWLTGGLFLQLLSAASAYPEMLEEMQALVLDLRSNLADYVQAYLEQEGMDHEQAVRNAELSGPIAVASIQGYLLQVSAGMSVDIDTYVEGLRALVRGDFG